MPNEEHVSVLRLNVEEWNRWRREKPQTRPDLGGADLAETNLDGADLSGADLWEAKLAGAYLFRANLRGANLSGAELVEANLSGADLAEANISLATLKDANMSLADLRGAYFHGADLSGTDLHSADLSGADLSEADLSGVYLSLANLSGADLSGTYLCGAFLSGANLSRANLSGADLHGADLSGADLSGADLSGANLGSASITEANLSAANLRGSSIINTNLSGADLNGADITGAMFWDCTTRGWNTEDIKAEFLYLTDNQWAKEEHRKEFGEGEFEKSFVRIEKTLQMTLKMPFTDSSSFIGKVIAQSVNYLESDPVIVPKGMEAAPDGMTRFTFTVVNDSFYKNRLHLLEESENLINKYLSDDPAGLLRGIVPQEEDYKAIEGAPDQALNLPPSLTLHPNVLFERISKSHTKTLKLGETIFLLISRVLSR